MMTCCSVHAMLQLLPLLLLLMYMYNVCMQTPFWFLILCIPIPIETNSEKKCKKRNSKPAVINRNIKGIS